jgi:hypothetical protein
LRNAATLFLDFSLKFAPFFRLSETLRFAKGRDAATSAQAGYSARPFYRDKRKGKKKAFLRS